MSLKKLANQVKRENRERERTVEELFIAAIDQFMVNQAIENDDPSRKRKAHNPSSFYKCWRAKWYELNDFPQKDRKVIPRIQRVLGIGTITHEWIQSILMEMGKRADSPIQLIPVEELPVFGKPDIEFISNHKASPMEIKFIDWRYSRLFPISAMVDGAIRFASKDIILEFKTMNTKDFQLLIEVPLDYRKQGAMYSLCLGIRYVMFLFIDKDTQELKAFLVEYEEKHHEWVKERIIAVERYFERGELPPKEVSEKCGLCPFKYFCDNDISEKDS